MVTKKTEPIAAGAAADTLERLSLQYQGILEAAATLRAVGSYDAAIGERERRIKELDEEHAKRKGEFARLNERAAKQTAELDQLAADATGQAQASVAAGREKAEELIAAASEHAAQILSEARSQAELITRGAREDAHRHTTTSTAAQAEVVEAKARLDALKGQIELAEEQLATARGKLRELLGTN